MIERGEEDFVPERDGREAVGKIRGLGSVCDDAALFHDTSAERESTFPVSSVALHTSASCPP